MRQQKACKVTITLPEKLLQVADRLAEEQSTTRSGLIAKLLKKAEEEQLVAWLLEDKEWQVEGRQIAADFRPNAVRMMQRTPWDEKTGG